jgi:hypothetical protein
LHRTQNDSAFELLWWGRHIEELPDKRAQTPFALGTVGTWEATLQVRLDIQAFFDLQGMIEKNGYIALTLLTG